MRILPITYYDQWQNIMGILKSVFKLPPLPIDSVASR